jgi:ABC-type transport system substrate-binding protein
LGNEPQTFISPNIKEKKPMKRTYFALLLILALILAACGGSTTPDSEEVSAPAGDTTAADSSTEEEAAPAEEVADEEMEEEEAPVEEVVVEEEAEEEVAEEVALPNVLKVSATANVTTWDPIKSFSTEALYMANFYEQLLRVNPPDAAEPFTPLLAESWEVSEDGLTWTFNLRDGVFFHDGEPLTATAVKLSLEAAAERAGASFIWFPLDSINVVDDLTVDIVTSYPASIDLIASSLYGAWIVSPAALEAAAADETYFEAGIEAGTGPYMLESYTPDLEVLMTAFDSYWGGWEEGQYDKVLVQIVPEAVQQQQMLEGGEVDLALRIPQENYATFADREGYTLVSEPAYFNYLGFFNTLRPPFDNATVRQALSYAIPYQDIIDVATFGQATQARGAAPAGVWPYTEDVNQYSQDLDMARQLLEEAGYADGFDMRLTYAAENSTEERFAPLIKDAFAEIGVNVEIEPILFNQQWEEAKTDPENAQDMFLLLYWPTYSDAGSDNLWSMFRSSAAPFFNLSYWANEQFDALIDEAGVLTVTDPERAQELYNEAQNLMVEEAPAVFFFDTKAPFVIPDHVGGFDYNINYPFATFFYDLFAQ